MPNSTVPFTGTTGKWGARLKATAASGDLDTLVASGLQVYDIRDFGAVDNDSTDCASAYQSAINQAITDAGAGPAIIYTPASTSYWRIKSTIVKRTGSHTDFGAVRQLVFVGEGDAGPVRIDCSSSVDVFDLDVGNGQTAYRDFRGGFFGMTFVTSNASNYAKGVDCRNLFAISNADTSIWAWDHVRLVGIWAQDNILTVINGSYRFDDFIVGAGFAGSGGGQSIALLSTWALLEGHDIFVNEDAHLRGTTWSSSTSAFSALFEVKEPQDYDSLITLDGFFADNSCARIVWCNQVAYATANRVRKIVATNAVLTIGQQASFDVDYCVAVEIDNVEFELGSGSVFIDASNCDDSRLHNVRATYGGTSMHGLFDSTCKSVLVEECDLGTDSPYPNGIGSDAVVTRVVKGGVWYKLHSIGSVYVLTDGAESTWYQPSALGEAYTAGVTHFATDLSVGSDLIATKKGIAVAGVRFYWDGSAAKTIRCSIWNPNASRAAFVDVSVPAVAGIYEGKFSAPVLLDPYKQYMISTREQTGSRYMYMLAGGVSSGTGGTIVYADMFKKAIANGLVRQSCYFASGDACPSNTDTADLFFVEPLLC